MKSKTAITEEAARYFCTSLGLDHKEVHIVNPIIAKEFGEWLGFANTFMIQTHDTPLDPIVISDLEFEKSETAVRFFLGQNKTIQVVNKDGTINEI